jgi:phenylpyruvate tautomerase PptA (4-oxalocrotonate tautomerase family)
LPESDLARRRLGYGRRMPYYQFHIPAGSPSAARKAELAAAVTKVHTAVTGAPARYVNVAFFELAPGSLFVADQPRDQGRMVGIIRSGRSPEVKHDLITGLADAWTAVTGEPREGFALFLQEVPGSMAMEYGETLPEAEFD